MVGPGGRDRTPAVKAEKTPIDFFLHNSSSWVKIWLLGTPLKWVKCNIRKSERKKERSVKNVLKMAKPSRPIVCSWSRSLQNFAIFKVLPLPEQ